MPFPGLNWERHDLMFLFFYYDSNPKHWSEMTKERHDLMFLFFYYDSNPKHWSEMTKDLI